ncbi:alpha/beta fold hydrolase [Kribbella sindirgiensis]|uniref:alpha/beta fold hydrolase n=1 Tax=Kribbella sindirgiensis TaxID=1124744 RepID=UPI001EE0D9F4|nr:hypothetical protein [Kribbella sindirgiensis]
MSEPTGCGLHSGTFGVQRRTSARTSVPYKPVVRATADGPPVVLLPGHGATSPVWFAIAPRLAEKYRVYAIDLIVDAGRGKSHDPASLTRQVTALSPGATVVQLETATPLLPSTPRGRGGAGVTGNAGWSFSGG